MIKLKQKIKDRLGAEKAIKLKKSLRVARIIKNITCWTIIAVMTLAIIIYLLTRANGVTPSVFGFSIQRITLSGMEPELAIGDIIINRDLSDETEVHIGDIVTFRGGSEFAGQMVARRVLVAPYDDGRGNTVLVTKGDANESDDGEINITSVESRFYAKADVLKAIYKIFFSVWGLILFIFLLLLIFVDEFINIIRITVGDSEQQKKMIE